MVGKQKPGNGLLEPMISGYMSSKIRWGLPKKQTNAGCTECALMTSQLRHNFQASQAETGAFDITTPHF